MGDKLPFRAEMSATAATHALEDDDPRPGRSLLPSLDDAVCAASAAATRTRPRAYETRTDGPTACP